MDGMSTPVEPQTFYDIVGGHETFVASGPASTRASLADPELRALNPEEDLADAEERLRMFREQYWGGPTTCSPASRPSAPSNATCALCRDIRRCATTGRATRERRWTHSTCPQLQISASKVADRLPVVL